MKESDNFEIKFNIVGTIGSPDTFDDVYELKCRVYADAKGLDTGLKTDLCILEIQDDSWEDGLHTARLILSKHNIRQLSSALKFAKKELCYDN